MPSPIDALKHRLVESVRVLTPEGRMFSSAGVDKLRKTVDRIRNEIGDRPATPGKDRICGALAVLRSHGAANLDGAQFYFACWGLTESCGNQPPLIEDGRHFPAMMVEIQKRQPRTLLWRGLLDAYFRYTPQAGSEGEKNWRLLRNWLAKDLKTLRGRIPAALRELSWLTVLQTNYVLLADDPCRPYAASALQGDRTQIAKIEQVLGITQASWFWRELVFSQIEEAAGWREDARFKLVLDTLLTQLAKHPVLTDKGLSKLLTRYAKCTNIGAHEGLKQFAVKPEREGGWGSPQMVQQVKWGLVEPSVKTMVSQWLVKEDLEDFFERLQAGGLADTRRLNFWMLFIKQISFSHVALSGHLCDSRQPNWVQFQDKRKGRFSRLEGGGGGKNAFIMKIGGYYFVEFGVTGDACYGYVEGQQPFRLGSGLLNYPTDLKNMQRKIFRGRHADGHLKWESVFIREFANLGI